MGKPVLLDVDPGCDDAVLLALAIARDDVDIVGVTTVAGNTALPDATRNALSVLERLDRPDVPVVPGCDRPIVRALETAEDIHGTGGLPERPTEPTIEPEDTDAVSFLLEQSRTVDDLTVIATGPLTNIAVALAVDPSLPHRIDLAVMGGAAQVAGNVTDAAEFNFYVDPEAAARVVRDASPRIVGLDVTQRATLPPARIESLVTRGEPLRSIAGWLAYTAPGTIQREGIDEPVPLHDPVVLVDLLDGVLTYESTALQVDHTSGITRGALTYDDRDGGKPATALAVDIDVEYFRTAVFDAVERLA